MTEIDFIIDDFAAGGGWEQGIREAGYTGPMIGVEFDKAAVLTAQANGHTRVHGDVRTETAPLIERMITQHNVHGLRTPRWLYIASPPCQTFSAAGKGAGRKHLDSLLTAVVAVAHGATPEAAIAMASDTVLDERSVLVLHPLHIIEQYRPQLILLEQVKEALPVWNAYADALRAMGYVVRTEIIKTEKYGVAQSRRRAVLSASLIHDEAPWPTATHSEFYPRNKAKRDEGVPSFVTMAQALGQGMTERPSMTVTGGGTGGGGPEPFASGSRKGMLRELEAGRWRFVPVAANEGTTPEDMAWVETRPAMTVVGSFAPDVMAAPGYRGPGDGPRQKARGSVRLTIQQALVLQSFPADYVMVGNKSEHFQIVGNAVPPKIGEVFYRAIVG